MSYTPSLQCLKQAYVRLAGTDGFNALLAEACADINKNTFLYQRIEPFEVDFKSLESVSFYLGAYDVGELKSSGFVTQPVIILYARGADEGPRPSQKFQVFSGVVTVIIDVHLSWPGEKPRKNAESLGCAVEAALIELFNRDIVLASGQHNSFWTEEIAYNGEIHVLRGEVASETEGWSQLIRATLNFEVNAPNH